MLEGLQEALKTRAAEAKRVALLGAHEARDPPHTSSPLAGQGPHCLLLPLFSSPHLLPVPLGPSYLAGCTKRAVLRAEPAGESAKRC